MSYAPLNRDPEEREHQTGVFVDPTLNNPVGATEQDSSADRKFQGKDCMSTTEYPHEEVSGFIDAPCHLIIKLRHLLRDTCRHPKVNDPNWEGNESGFIYSDDELSCYLTLTLIDINSHPTTTYYDWDTVPTNWYAVIAYGAQWMAWNSEAILEAAKQYSITENGITFTPPDIAASISSAADKVYTHFNDLKEKIKRNVKPSPRGVGGTRILYPQPFLAKLRHLKERRIL